MRKKVAHLTFDMSIGGAEQVIVNLVSHTDQSKYDVSVICLQEPLGPLGRKLQNNGYVITSLERKPGLDLDLIRGLRDYIRRQHIDVLHCHQYTPFVYGVFSSLCTRTRIVFTEHGRFHPDRRKAKRVLVNPILSRLADHVTAISAATRDALITYENMPESKIRVIYNGLDDSPYLGTLGDAELKRSLGVGVDARVLGTVARLDPIKNHKMMIKALAKVLKTCPDTFLVIVGDGPERATLESFAIDRQVFSHVVFTGFREDVYRYLKIMDLFLLTSFSEGTAMTLLEAMACGIPCIATKVGGNPEIVADGETGFLIPDDEEQALAERILCLLRSRDLLKQMGAAGRKKFEERFTVQKMVRSYQELYG
jgi:glycosyltransferase involved in cell wall biosynthesis